jgi:hypothetical protein
MASDDLQKHHGVLGIGLLLSLLGRLGEMSWTEDMALDSIVMQLIAKPVAQAGGFIGKNDPFRPMLFGKFEQHLDHFGPPSGVIIERSLLGHAIADAILQKHGTEVQITTNHDNLRHSSVLVEE